MKTLLPKYRQSVCNCPISSDFDPYEWHCCVDDHADRDTLADVIPYDIELQLEYCFNTYKNSLDSSSFIPDVTYSDLVYAVSDDRLTKLIYRMRKQFENFDDDERFDDIEYVRKLYSSNCPIVQPDIQRLFDPHYWNGELGVSQFYTLPGGPLYK